LGSSAVDDPRFIGYRRKLIEEIRRKGITDLDLLSLFDAVPRHHFLPEGVRPRAYEDSPIPIGFGQTASQPSLQAYFMSMLKPVDTDVVLEIGTGCGFLTALLASRADRVYSVERIRELSHRSRDALDAMEFRNVALMVGDGTIGWRKYAPYDVIVVSAGAPDVPPALVDQLAEGGRLLIPVGGRDEQELRFIRRVEGELIDEPVEGHCKFVPLLGSFAWAPEGESL
jgi:protein-L-isoaspartate(D-aspartate) O-methyltransferase